MNEPQVRRLVRWFVRLSVGTVLAVNTSCAAAFLLAPERYSGSFEIGGLPGITVVRAFGILFLMWNATYPPVLIHPDTHQTLLGVILLQQAIGIIGETWIWFGLPAGHAVLRQTGLRFIVHGTNWAEKSYAQEGPAEAFALWDEAAIAWARQTYQSPAFQEVRGRYVGICEALKSEPAGPRRSQLARDLFQLREG